MLKLTFNNYSVNGYLIGLLLRTLTIIHLPLPCESRNDYNNNTPPPHGPPSGGQGTPPLNRRKNS
jgi:hypothetical protein